MSALFLPTILHYCASFQIRYKSEQTNASFSFPSMHRSRMRRLKRNWQKLLREEGNKERNYRKLPRLSVLRRCYYNSSAEKSVLILLSSSPISKITTNVLRSSFSNASQRQMTNGG